MLISVRVVVEVTMGWIIADVGKTLVVGMITTGVVDGLEGELIRSVSPRVAEIVVL